MKKIALNKKQQKNFYFTYIYFFSFFSFCLMLLFFAFDFCRYFVAVVKNFKTYISCCLLFFVLLFLFIFFALNGEYGHNEKKSEAMQWNKPAKQWNLLEVYLNVSLWYGQIAINSLYFQQQQLQKRKWFFLNWNIELSFFFCKILSL